MAFFTGCQVESDDGSGNEPAAKISYTVKFDKNGGEGKLPDDITATVGEEFSLPTAELTKTGYDFKGWCASADGTGSTYETGKKVKDLSTENGATITLYAKWVLHGSWSINYVLNGDEANPAQNAESNPTDYNVETAVITLADPTRNLYEFAGWYDNAEFTGDKLTGWNAGEKTGNITLYAKWVVTAANVSEAIANLTEEGTHTVTVAGEITSDTLTKLANAISGLAENVNVILDLVGTTGLTEIPEDFMSNQDESLAGLVIPASVTEIKSNFWSCSNLSVLKVAENNPAYKSVGNIIYTKDGQTLVLAARTLTEATIPANVVTIGIYAFQTCDKLQKVTFEQGSLLEKIEDYAFSDCNELTEITLPSTLRTLGEYAFNCCFELKSITLPEGIKTIPTCTFINCMSLAEISLPSTLESIGKLAFYNMGLSIVKYNGTKDDWNVLKANIGTYNENLLNAAIYCSDGSLNTDAVSLIKRLGEGEHTVTVTGEVSAEYLTKIANAIKEKGYVTKITLDLSDTTGLTEIPKEIFSDNYALVGIVLPQSVTSIGESAFQYSELSEIVIPDSVTEIGINAFDTCKKLKSVKIGAKVAKIGNLAFSDTALTSIEIPGSVTSVGTQIFQDCGSLKNVTIGKGLASISSSMFISCSALEEIVIPDGVKSIERCAFDSCEKLETITIPASVTLIEDYAFDCTSLANVYYGGTVAEWNALKDDGKISSTGNNALFNATIHCTNGDITPTTGA